MATQALDQKQTGNQTRAFVIAWFFTVIFYFLEYAVRSSPSVIISELEASFQHHGSRHRLDSGNVLLHLFLYEPGRWSGS